MAPDTGHPADDNPHRQWCPSRKGAACICAPEDADCTPNDHRCDDPALPSQTED